MDYLMLVFVLWCITTLIGLVLFLIPVLWRKYVVKRVAMDDHFGLPFFLLSSIPVFSVIIYLVYIFYLIPLSWVTSIILKIEEKTKQPIKCPHCGMQHEASEYNGESFHTSQPCKSCGKSMIVSKTDIKGVYTTATK
jgi:ABC-type dipeptide/oligopeptide/nickel transport system permease component